MTSWGEILRRAIESVIAQSAALLPRILVTALLIVMGVVIASIAKAMFRVVLGRAGFDRLAELTGINRALKQIGYEKPASHLVGIAVFWTILAIFILSGADTLGLAAVSAVIGRLIALIPTLVIVVVILLIGLSMARTARRAVEGVSERSRVASAKPLGIAAYYLIVALTAIVALSGLGVDFTIVTAVVVVILGSLGVGLAVMLGLGSREVARNTISGMYARKEVRVGDRIRVGEISGEVVAVSQVMLTVEDKGRTWLVPYEQIMTSIIEVIERSPAKKGDTKSD